MAASNDYFMLYNARTGRFYGQTQRKNGKRWETLGSLKLHISGIGLAEAKRRYGGHQIMRFVATSQPEGDIDSMLDEMTVSADKRQKAREAQRLADSLRAAQERVKRAEADLARAQAAASKPG